MLSNEENMKVNELIKLIKKTSATRIFDSRCVSTDYLNKVISAGRWSLSIHAIQPWRIILIRDSGIINDISSACYETSDSLYSGYRQVLASTAETIKHARTIIIVFNKQPFSLRAQKLGRKYKKVVKNAEIQCISAFMQNMNLAMSSLNLKSVWLTTCLFAENRIKRILNVDEELIAILCVGFSNKNIRRSRRDKTNDFVSYRP